MNCNYIAIIGLLEEYRGHNIGSIILNDIVQKSIEDNKHIKLHVNINNYQAVKLYEKFGFKVIKTNKHYYENGDDAYTMKL